MGRQEVSSLEHAKEQVAKILQDVCQGEKWMVFAICMTDEGIKQGVTTYKFPTAAFLDAAGELIQWSRVTMEEMRNKPKVEEPLPLADWLQGVQEKGKADKYESKVVEEFNVEPTTGIVAGQEPIAFEDKLITMPLDPPLELRQAVEKEEQGTIEGTPEPRPMGVAELPQAQREAVDLFADATDAEYRQMQEQAKAMAAEAMGIPPNPVNGTVEASQDSYRDPSPPSERREDPEEDNSEKAKKFASRVFVNLPETPQHVSDNTCLTPSETEEVPLESVPSNIDAEFIQEEKVHQDGWPKKDEIAEAVAATGAVDDKEWDTVMDGRTREEYEKERLDALEELVDGREKTISEKEKALQDLEMRDIVGGIDRNMDAFCQKLDEEKPPTTKDTSEIEGVEDSNKSSTPMSTHFDRRDRDYPNQDNPTTEDPND